MKENTERNGLEIAIIGMSGRFPGANNVDEFWENLKNGVNSIRFFTQEELWEKSSVDPESIKAPNFVPAKGIIENVEAFDALFFGYSPIEAELLDPQIRVFYEICWEALEDAACDPATYPGTIGVYAGGSSNRYWEVLTLITGKQDVLGTFSAGTMVDKDYLSSRVSNKLDLRGPSVSMHTACSTAMVATDLACRGLLTGQCDAAVVGGVSVTPESARAGGYLYEDGMIFSPDGYCRAFDAKARGTVFSYGAGAFLLKRLDDAVADGNNIYAVIKGFSANNDGMAKSSFSAPSVDGQAAAVRAALYMAEVSPESISYVEAHGTGTELGDPIEVEALRTAFNTDKKQYCALGSLKTNIGHLDVAAGAASVIKVALMLTHRQIPASLNYETPNPKIDFENSPFFVNTQLREWKSNGYPLRAGASSFGVGGTNVHIVLEEAPPLEPSTQSRTFQPVLLSARTPKALDHAAVNFVNYLKANPGVSLADAAYTLAVGRKAFEHKKMLVCRDVEEALAILAGAGNETSPQDQPVQSHFEKEQKRAVFMFPGQGSQYVDMAKGVYESEPVFREEMDRCFQVFQSVMGYDLKEILYPRSPQSSDSTQINRTEMTQPAIFVIEYALAKLLMAWGIQPYAMIGHSIGEYTAACLSGVFSLEDALTVVAWRGKLMQQMPPGSMLSVPMAETELEQLLARQSELELAAVNGPEQCVVSGPHEAVETFARRLDEKGLQYRRLHTSHAFHSQMMDPMLKNFEEKVARVKRNAPTIPFISNVTGQWITLQDASSPNYWSRHLRSAVRFADGVSELVKEKNSVFIEVGPGRTLSTFMRQHPGKQPEHMLVNLVRHPKEEVSDSHYLLSRLGQVWLYGAPVDWNGFYAGERRHRLRLPTYPYQRQKYWIEGNPGVMIREGMGARSIPGKKPHISDWFYLPSWKRSFINPEPPLTAAGQGDDTGDYRWLVFSGESENGQNGDFGSRLVKRLMAENHRKVTVVRMGERFAKQDDHVYTVSPGRPEDYEALIDALDESGAFPNRVVHLWNLSPGTPGEPGLNGGDVEKSMDLAFYSLLYLAQALGRKELEQEVHITTLTDGMQEVWQEPVVYPEKALVLGPVMVIPREYPEIKCRSIDVMLPAAGDKEENLLERLSKELDTRIHDADAVIAYRGNHRLVRTFEPAPLEPSAPGDLEVPAVSGIPKLRQGGVYLITGGLGGIGLVLALYMAKNIKPKLVLTGRSAFPPPEEWDQWLSTQNSLDGTSQKIRKVRELEALGAEVRVYSVDVTDQQEMRRVVEETCSRWGTLHGVIHSAGVPGGGVIQLKTREMADSVLAPKVKGTLALHRAIEGIQPDFFILCSSVGSVVPAVGQVDYFAGNAFMDAFAFYRNAGSSTFTVSINWDSWQEVGMAVEAAKQFAGDSYEKSAESQPLIHPLLDHYITRRLPAGGEQAVFTTFFSIRRHWVLSGHRSKEKRGIVPGVTYLEMAHAAFSQLVSDQHLHPVVEIRNVSFLTPLMVEIGDEREARMTLKQKGDGFEFVARSRVNPGENKWEHHAKGEVGLAPDQEETPKIHDIGAIRQRCNRGEMDVAASWDPDAEGSLLIFGPRWGNLKRVNPGENEGLAFLELSDEFSGELEQFTLYPSLLDMAAAFLSGIVRTENPYIPYGYKRLKVFRAFPRRLYVYCRVAEGGLANRDFLKFDIAIMNEEGVVLVDIEEFTMLEISGEILGRLKGKEHGEIQTQVSMQPEADPTAFETGGDELVKDGILPSEGVDAFTRILREEEPQVVVSTRDLAARIEAGLNAGASDLSQLAQEAASAGAVYSRPDLSTTYLEPSTEGEKKMAGIWQELLGIDQVGIMDDFFELGGDSLKAAAMIAKIKQVFNTDISVREIFNAPRVKELAKGLGPSAAAAEVSEYTRIPPAEKKEYYSASAMQKRLYVLEQMEGIGTTYNLPYALVLDGKIDIERLEGAFRLLIVRHESLRTSFELLDGEPVQIIHEVSDVDFFIEYSDVHKDDGEMDKDTLMKEFIRPFDLTAAPLIRVGIVKLPGEQYFMIFDVHHIAADGSSYMIILTDFFALLDGKELPRLDIQYKDFSQWQNSEVGESVLENQETYWLKTFKDEIPVLHLPTDYSRPVVQVFEGNLFRFSAAKEEFERLKRLAVEENATLFMVLLGLYYVFLSKLSRQEDI
ncbi:MAG: SDR family oxidoreductase, partial [bacterium]|nr:SDR family oxidoreductase [bacterium]